MSQLALMSPKQAAIAAGAARYFTGRPCKRGHVAERYIWGGCIDCVRLANEGLVGVKRELMRKKRQTPEGRAHLARIVRESAARNRDEVRARVERWRAENRGRLEEYEARRYAQDPAFFREKRKRWYRENRDRAAEQHRRYRASVPGVDAARHGRRRARKIGNGPGLTVREFEELVRAWDAFCSYCGEPKPLTADHVEPVARGGRHVAENIVQACQACNSSKKDKPLLIFLGGY